MRHKDFQTQLNTTIVAIDPARDRSVRTCTFKTHSLLRMSLAALLPYAAILLAVSATTGAELAGVKVWEDTLVVPTYGIGPPCSNPMFYHGRTYQGAQGRIYPYPMNDQLTGEKRDRRYKVIYLENEYVQLAILPELGGRIFWGIDKTNGYDFFYRQHVIKPALIGMLGAWISGGVEWNIPHHHRATTMMPVEYCIEHGSDGSQTVWLGEIERRDRMKWVVGLTLYPGKSVIEKSIRLFNRTPLANSMLYFANVAVHANENYQIIFPPSTQFGTHHSKVEFCRWPIGDGTYGQADFTGVDMSWHKNHPKAQLRVLLERSREFRRRLRSWRPRRHDVCRRSGGLHRQEVLHVGLRTGRKDVERDAHRRGRSLPGVDGRSLVRQPARL